MLSPKNGYKRIVSRCRNCRSTRETRVKVSYWPNDQIGSLKVKELNGNTYNGADMTLQYDERGRIIGREWVNITKQRFVAKRTFDPDGRLVREDIQRQWKKGAELQDFLSVEYHYLTEEEVLTSLEKEQIVRAEP